MDVGFVDIEQVFDRAYCSEKDDTGYSEMDESPRSGIENNGNTEWMKSIRPTWIWYVG